MQVRKSWQKFFDTILIVLSQFLFYPFLKPLTSPPHWLKIVLHPCECSRKWKDENLKAPSRVNMQGAIQNRRKCMLITKGAYMLHNNVHSHTANTTKALLNSFGRDLLNHLAYSPDLTPSDFHIYIWPLSFPSKNKKNFLWNSSCHSEGAWTTVSAIRVGSDLCYLEPIKLEKTCKHF